MKAKGIVLSLMASTLINIPNSFAVEYKNLTKLTKAKKSKLELYPVKISKTEIKNGLFLDGKNYLQLTKKPVLVIEDFDYQSLTNNQIGVELLLSDKENKALSKLTEKYINTRLAVVFNNTVLMVPSIKSIVNNNSIELSFNDPKKLESVLNEFKDS